MIAFILAAGASTRLKPDTLSRHKCLLEIFDKKKIPTFFKFNQKVSI